MLRREVHTEEARVRSHVCALKHLRKASKSPYYTFDHLEGCLCVLIEAVGQAVGIIGVHPRLAHASIHPVHASHTPVHATITATVSTIH